MKDSVRKPTEDKATVLVRVRKTSAAKVRESAGKSGLSLVLVASRAIDKGLEKDI